jgi:NAD(P)-dependent dehydrogenase (short-subunit alcohol dehydrogenase family)
MSGRLEGKVAVITGGAGGIGREAALLFSAEGARVCVADVSQDLGEQTAAKCENAFFHPVDVADEQSVAELFEAAAARYGGIDVIYNNAGIMPPGDGSVLDVDLDTWNRVNTVNATGVFLGCKHGIPHLLERGGGSVINVASFVAVMGAATSQIAYTASKGAVLSLSRELAVEFARRGVRVNALCPGPVETPLLMHLFENDPEAYARRLVHLPMGRLAQAHEIAAAALFLASDESSYVTGTTFLVDGAITAAYVTPE